MQPTAPSDEQTLIVTAGLTAVRDKSRTKKSVHVVDVIQSQPCKPNPSDRTGIVLIGLHHCGEVDLVLADAPVGPMMLVLCFIGALLLLAPQLL